MPIIRPTNDIILSSTIFSDTFGAYAIVSGDTIAVDEGITVQSPNRVISADIPVLKYTLAGTMNGEARLDSDGPGGFSYRVGITETGRAESAGYTFYIGSNTNYGAYDGAISVGNDGTVI